MLMASWEIVPTWLWQGDKDSLSEIDKYDLVVSCAPDSEMRPESIACLSSCKLRVYFPFADVGDLPNVEIAMSVANFVEERMFRDRILVHCAGGRNRSGLIIALAMSIDDKMSTGKCDMQSVINRIKAANPLALQNDTFVKYLLSLPG
jgi:predicted protein tyrosine phosphatase